MIIETIKKFRPIECPNCGAPLRSENCEYCGLHIDFGTNFQIEIEYRRLKKELEQKRCAIAQQSQINQISTVLYTNIVPFRVGQKDIKVPTREEGE